MARIYLDRLTKKYSPGTVRTGKYRKLVEEIMEENTTKLNRTLFKITDDHYKKENKRITKKEKRFSLPELEDVLPRKTISVRKSAEKGSLITDDLRDKLSTRLKETLKKKGLETKTGKMAGTLKKEVLAEFEQNIRKTFVNYTKKDPKFKVPGNVRNIATTELRSAVAEIKSEYNKTILEKNPDAKMTKTWIHNMGVLKSRKNARQGHVKLNGKTIGFDKMFTIWGDEGVYEAPYPHHSSLPAGEVIACQCEILYRVKK